MTTLLPPGEISDALLTRYAALIYERTGIHVSPQKKTLLSNRLRRRLRETGIAGFEEYFCHVSRLRGDDPEWDAFLQEITTHETYLFRDEQQWDWFRQSFLPQMAAEARGGQRSRALRIWSAAASTGDEAFTVACCIAACLPNFSQWQIKILGTDIGIGAIEQAREALFNERAMKLVSDKYRRSYFKKEPAGELWRARPVLADMTAFRQHNLLEPLAERPFDLVLLKNVLIYFDTESKLKVLKNVRGLMAPGGLLVAGGAEGVSDLLEDLERVQTWLYRRPVPARRSP